MGQYSTAEKHWMGIVQVFFLDNISKNNPLLKDKSLRTMSIN